MLKQPCLSNDSLEMAEEERYVGERLSFKGQLCTVRYVGTVADKSGSWLGVEWDDANRGKHNGTHASVNYFTCMMLLRQND